MGSWKPKLAPVAASTPRFNPPHHVGTPWWPLGTPQCLPLAQSPTNGERETLTGAKQGGVIYPTHLRFLGVPKVGGVVVNLHYDCTQLDVVLCHKTRVASRYVARGQLVWWVILPSLELPDYLLLRSRSSGHIRSRSQTGVFPAPG